MRELLYLNSLLYLNFTEIRLHLGLRTWTKQIGPIMKFYRMTLNGLKETNA